ncbi:hypothetical protein [Desulfobulbus elongatus]|uniref:hypothetical protein n=1 Tax=Desulfobulbus elongatus TaxID=53332 RepID=UPI0012FA05E0|nr:hypothetical protein [Desulfobulbus elongatus]
MPKNIRPRFAAQFSGHINIHRIFNELPEKNRNFKLCAAGRTVPNRTKGEEMEESGQLFGGQRWAKRGKQALIKN